MAATTQESPAALAGAELARILRDSSEEIVLQWARDLRAGSLAAYADRPLDDLEAACRQCLEGYVAVIERGDFSRVRRFIHRQVRTRVAQGARASEIARALCLFEDVAWPIVTQHYVDRPWELATAFARVRHCVTQALFEFSDLYELAASQRVEAYLAEMETVNRRLEELSVRDSMTGLYNRRYFHDRLTNEFARARPHQPVDRRRPGSSGGRPLSLLMVDIDHFKRVNDAFGHQAGDEVLRAVALLLVNQTRTTDVTARYGGEEFAAVLPETDRDGALQVAEKPREQIAFAPLHRLAANGSGGESLVIHCTASIGVAVYDPATMADSADLVRAADAALYCAKRSGRNQVAAAWTLPAGAAES